MTTTEKSVAKWWHPRPASPYQRASVRERDMVLVHVARRRIERAIERRVWRQTMRLTWAMRAGLFPGTRP